MSERRLLICVSCLCLGALFYIYSPFILGLRELACGDQAYIYEPICRYVGDAFRSGRLPLWNDMVHTGMPQIAVISPGLFYPPNHVLFLLPFSRGLSFYMIFHQLLLSASLYFCCRRLGLSSYSSWLAALCGGSGGYMFAMLKFPDFAGIAWIPTLLLMIDIFFRDTGRKRVIAFAMIACSLSMLILAGRPENFVPGFFLAGLLLSAELLISIRSGRRCSEMLYSCALCFAALLCGVGISGVVILPSLEWLKLSHRAAGLRFDEMFQWSCIWYDWLSVAFLEPVGDLLRAPASDMHRNLIDNYLLPLTHTGRGDARPWCGSFYQGSAYSLCAFIGIFSLRWRPLVWLLPAAIFFALLASGSQTAFAPLFFSLFPAFAIIRYPVKLLIFPLILAVPLAAKGLDCIIENSLGMGALLALLAVEVFALVIFSLPGSQAAPGILSWMCRSAGSYMPQPVAMEVCSRLSFSLIAGFLLLLLLTFLTFCYKRRFLSLRVFQSVAAILLLSPLLANGMATQKRSTESGFYENSPLLVDVLKRLINSDRRQGRVALFEGGRGVLISDSYVKGLKVEPEDLVTACSRDRLEYNSSMNFGVKCATGYELGETAAFTSLREKAELYSRTGMALSEDGRTWTQANDGRCDFPYARFCALSATDYVLTRSDETRNKPIRLLNQRIFDPCVVDIPTCTRVYRLRVPARRIYFADRVWPLNSEQEFIRLFCDFRKLESLNSSFAYLDADSLKRLPSALSYVSTDSKSEAKKDRIDILLDEPEKVVIHSEKSQSALLVLRDQFYPGWRAFVDGVEVPVFRANLVNRAVFVEGGKHQIVFEYRPESLFNGIKVALISLLSVSVISFLLWRSYLLGGRV